jgi:hypothetical protein
MPHSEQTTYGSYASVSIGWVLFENREGFSRLLLLLGGQFPSCAKTSRRSEAMFTDHPDMASSRGV